MKAAIRFSPDILRRLGEELTPSPDVSVLELVKNSYDADALACRVELRGTDRPGGTIVVTDNGDGMDAAQVERGWLLLGKSPKTREAVTRLGRTPSGSKGLGRLAALRMGQLALLTSRPRHRPEYECQVRINWDDYSDVEHVGDVQLDVKEGLREQGVKHGTRICIQRLRTSVGRMVVKRLARGLVLLADPFGEDPEAFRPRLVAPEFEDLERLVEERYFDDAEYHLIAELTADGLATAEVHDFKGDVIYSGTHDEIAPNRAGRGYRAPTASFHLWVFILNRQTFSTRNSTIGEVREWLGEFGGVHLYENGLRVQPYGNPGNDWLDMNLRRARSPEERPSTNTSIGKVSVSNPEDVLVQKTDRSGFIETDSFEELRSFCQDSMDWLAGRRLADAERRRTQQRKSAEDRVPGAQRNLEAAIDALPEASRKEVERSYHRYDRTRERQAAALRKEVQLYRTLSTAGIAAAALAHDSRGGPAKNIVLNARQVQKAGRRVTEEALREQIVRSAGRMLREGKSLLQLNRSTLNLVAKDKRRFGAIDVHNVISQVMSEYRALADDNDIDIEVQFCSARPVVKGSQAAIESILVNLLTNSLAAIDRSAATDRRILIRTQIKDDEFVINFHDSGPGIVDIPERRIWLPGETTKKNGTGLGLTIVRDTVTDMGGEVNATTTGDLGGAAMTVRLPLSGGM